MAYCKYFNDDCYAPHCAAYPHSITNKCPHIIASEEELKKIDKEQDTIIQEQKINKKISFEEAERICHQIMQDYDKK